MPEGDFFIPLKWSLLEREHIERIGEAIWLLLELLKICDWKTGEFHYNQSHLARQWGVGRITIVRWHHKLEAHGYINSERGRYEISGRVKNLDKLLRRKEDVSK